MDRLRLFLVAAVLALSLAYLVVHNLNSSGSRDDRQGRLDAQLSPKEPPETEPAEIVRSPEVVRVPEAPRPASPEPDPVPETDDAPSEVGALIVSEDQLSSDEKAFLVARPLKEGVNLIRGEDGMLGMLYVMVEDESGGSVMVHWMDSPERQAQLDEYSRARFGLEALEWNVGWDLIESGATEVYVTKLEAIRAAQSLRPRARVEEIDTGFAVVSHDQVAQDERVRAAVARLDAAEAALGERVTVVCSWRDPEGSRLRSEGRR